MGADIHSFLEVKDSDSKRWLVVGKNLTVEHFDLEKECPELGIKFSMGDMDYDWRDVSEYWIEWLKNLKQNPKLQQLFDYERYPQNTRERILLKEYQALRIGHKSEDERIVEPFSWRSYVMFGILANCRYEDDEIEAIAAPKGWPSNPSDFGILYNLYYESEKIHDEDDYFIVSDGNLHHISYLTVGEIEEWLKDPLSHAKTEAMRKDLEDYYIKYVTILKDELKKLMISPKVEDIRMVFGFDS